MNFTPNNELFIQRAVNKVLSNFLICTLPDNVDTYVKPFVHERIAPRIFQMTDLKSLDLYGNLRVFIRNHKFLRDSNILNDNTALNCANIILNWRNKIAHRSYSDILESYEQSLIEILAVNRLFSLLPLDESNNEELNNIRQETLRIYNEISNNYINTELSNNASSINNDIINDENNTIEEFVENNNDDSINSESRISRFEAIQLLKKLREEISEVHSDVLSYRNILRDSILEEFINHKITNEEQFKSSISRPKFLKTDPVQFEYFDKIKEIISRL